jgi:hypothetical protein
MNPKFVPIDGMLFLQVHAPDGAPTGELESYEVVERLEKRTDDNSGDKWFPQITVHQRCLLQPWRGERPEQMKPFGDRREAWILLENESMSMPFVSR